MSCHSVTLAERYAALRGGISDENIAEGLSDHFKSHSQVTLGECIPLILAHEPSSGNSAAVLIVRNFIIIGAESTVTGTTVRVGDRITVDTSTKIYIHGRVPWKYPDVMSHAADMVLQYGGQMAKDLREETVVNACRDPQVIDVSVSCGDLLLQMPPLIAVVPTTSCPAGVRVLLSSLEGAIGGESNQAGNAALVALADEVLLQRHFTHHMGAGAGAGADADAGVGESTTSALRGVLGFVKAALLDAVAPPHRRRLPLLSSSVGPADILLTQTTEEGAGGGTDDGVGRCAPVVVECLRRCADSVGLNTLSIDASSILLWYQWRRKHPDQAEAEAEAGFAALYPESVASVGVMAVSALLPCLVIVDGIGVLLAEDAAAEHYSQTQAEPGAGAAVSLAHTWVLAYRAWKLALAQETLRLTECSGGVIMGPEHWVCVVVGVGVGLTAPVAVQGAFLCTRELPAQPLGTMLAYLRCLVQGEDPLPPAEQGEIVRQGVDNPQVAPVRWADIGGMDDVRAQIFQLIALPLEHPASFHLAGPGGGLSVCRHGILLYGPPGTGKTMIARAVATECELGFISVKGPELLDTYVGESERNVREIFCRARAQAPCILFFDELDSLAPLRSRNSDGGSVMDRVVSQFLTEMDHLSVPAGAAGGAPRLVFVLGATNRPDLLDVALLRPGRFDHRIYLGTCSDVAQREAILRAQTRKLLSSCVGSQSDIIDYAAIAAAVGSNATGADLGAVVSAAYGLALERKLAELTVEAAAAAAAAAGVTLEMGADPLAWYIAHCSEEELRVGLTGADFTAAVDGMTYSVAVTELQRYEELHRSYH